MKNYYLIFLMLLASTHVFGMQKDRNILGLLRQREEGNFLRAEFGDIESASMVDRWLSHDDKAIEGLTVLYRWKLDGICQQIAQVIASRPSSLGRFFHKLSSFKNEKIIKGMIFMKFTEDYGYQYTEEILKQMVNEYNFDVNFIDQNISLVHWRQTPLHGAISRWDVTFTQKLLEWGADPFVKDTEGRTPYENMVHRKVNFEDATIKQLINLLNSACLPKEI